MDPSVFPATQLYLPLAFVLTIVSITATVILSDNSTDIIKGAVTGLWPLVILAVAFLHLYWICVSAAVTFVMNGQFATGFDLLVHAVVLLAITNLGIRLAASIASNRIEIFGRKIELLSSDSQAVTEPAETSMVESRDFRLPPLVLDLFPSRNALREYYRDILKLNDNEPCLNFTFDGKLVGDLGEAIAVEYFGLKLEGGSKEGIDGIAPDGRTVQVKATGTNRGPAFRNTAEIANRLLFFKLDYESCRAELVFNGPERIAREYLPAHFEGQRSLTPNQIREADQQVPESDRLPKLTNSKKLWQT